MRKILHQLRRSISTWSNTETCGERHLKLMVNSFSWTKRSKVAKKSSRKKDGKENPLSKRSSQREIVIRSSRVKEDSIDDVCRRSEPTLRILAWSWSACWGSCCCWWRPRRPRLRTESLSSEVLLPPASNDDCFDSVDGGSAAEAAAAAADAAAVASRSWFCSEKSML